MSHPDTLGVIVAGGLARRMGGADKMRIRIGDATILERVLTRLRPQCARAHSQRQYRNRALCRRWSACRRRQRAGFSRTARRHLGRARFCRGTDAGDRLDRQRAERLPVPAARSCAAVCIKRASMPARRLRARLRAGGAIRSSRSGPRPCARTCGARSPRKARAKSANGARDTLSQLRTGPSCRSTRSLMSTRRTTLLKPSGWRSAFRGREPAAALRLQHLQFWPTR